MDEGPASFPTRMPVLSLDRILGWPNGLVHSVEAHDTPLSRVASDHLPLKALLRLDLLDGAAEDATPRLASVG